MTDAWDSLQANSQNTLGEGMQRESREQGHIQKALPFVYFWHICLPAYLCPQKCVPAARLRVQERSWKEINSSVRGS